MQTSNISTFLVSLCRLADRAAAYSNPTSFSSPKTFHARPLPERALFEDAGQTLDVKLR
jgi:hypothetical protein